MKPLPVAIAISLLLLPGAAWACRNPAFTHALVHSKLPASLPDGMVAVEAAFPDQLTSGEFKRSGGGEARILRVIRGEVPARTVWVSSEDGQSSCDYAFSNGARGLLVGRLRQQNGRWVLEPEWVRRGDGYRLTRW